MQRMNQHVTQPASSFHREREETASSCYLIKSLTFERHVFMPLRKAPFDLPATIEGGSSVVTRSLSTHKPLHIRPTANPHTSPENAARHPPPSSTEAQGWAHHRPLQASTGPPFHGDGFHKSSGLGPLAFENTNPYRLGARGSPQHGEPLPPERHLQRTA